MLVLDCPISDDENEDEDEDERFARPATIWTDTRVRPVEGNLTFFSRFPNVAMS